MKAKRLSNEAEARELLKGYVITEKDMRLDEHSPTKGVIWDFKKPSEKGW